MAEDQSSIESGAHSDIKAYQSIPLEDFRNRFSSQTNPPNYIVEDSIGYFTTNEYDYPPSLSEIKVRGRLHLAVMGGLDPVFGQIAVAQPDLTIITDINDKAITTAIAGRILPLNDSQSAQDYWS